MQKKWIIGLMTVSLALGTCAFTACGKTGDDDGGGNGAIVTPGDDVPAATRIVEESVEYIWSDEENGYLASGFSFNVQSALTIPDTVNGYPVTGIGWAAFKGFEELKSVTIPDSVRRIEDRAFEGCENMTEVTIGNGVKEIGNSAFQNCLALTEITIGNGLTEIEIGAFNNTGYRNDEKNWEKGVLYIGKYLIEANTLLPGACTIKQETILIADYAFRDCTSLNSVEIPNSVTSIGKYAFSDCNSLTSITIPNGVTEIGSCTFKNCNSLTGITIPNSVTSIGWYAFSDCNSLTSITIPNSVTEIEEEAFKNCSGLKEAIIGDGVTKIEGNAFAECFQMTSIVIGSGMTQIWLSAFKGCINLSTVYYNGSAEEWKEIVIYANNTPIEYATKYYYIENETDVPQDGGNYWHYVNDVPTAWE